MLIFVGCTDDYLKDEIVADYDATVQDVFIKSAKFALLAAYDLNALSRAQDESNKKIKNLPSWVPDLTAHEPYCFEREESYLNSWSGEGISLALYFEGNIMVLAASQFDRIVAVGETLWTIRDRGTIREFLKVFLDAGQVYAYW